MSPKEVGSKARVSGCPVCKEREKAERKKAAEEAKNRERGYEQVSLFSFSEESEGGKA